jgi:outer membrane protein TolC
MVGCSSYIPKSEISDLNTVDNIDNIKSQDTNTKEVDSDNLVFSNEKWWLIYNDDNLNELMTLTLNSNNDLKIAKLNIEQATVSIDAVKSSNLKVGAYAEGGYKGVRKDYPKMMPVPGGGRGHTTYTESFGVRANYTFDLYDKYGNLANAQGLAAEATAFNLKLVQLSITTNVSKLYASYIYLNKEQKNLESRLTVLVSIRKQVKKGIEIGQGKDEDLYAVDNKILTLKRYINSNKLNIRSTKETLYALTNYSSKEDIDKILGAALKDPIMNKELIIPSKISSDVVTNRPDVQYYLLMMESEKAKLKAFKSDFYPQVSIGGDFGYTGVGFDNSFKDFSSLMWTLGPKVYLPIFNMSGVRTNYKIAGIQVNTFIANYNKTINNAVKDINTKLTAAQMEKLNSLNYKESFENDSKIFKNSEFRLKVGSISNNRYLNEKYTYLASSLNNEQQNFKLFTSQIDLINSLGGVYKTKEQIEEELKK